MRAAAGVTLTEVVDAFRGMLQLRITATRIIDFEDVYEYVVDVLGVRIEKEVEKERRALSSQAWG